MHANMIITKASAKKSGRICLPFHCESENEIKSSDFRVVFWQNGFFADFHCWAARFFRGFSRRIFSPRLCGEKVPRKMLEENPQQNPPKIYAAKFPDTRGAGPTDFDL